MAKIMRNKENGKKGILFTITTIILLLSLYLLAEAFMERNKELGSMMSNSVYGDKFKFIEDDIMSGSYRDLLDIKLEGISRGSTTDVKFDQLFLSGLRDYDGYMRSYETLVENKYASLNNLNATLTGFNTSFLMTPYNSTFEMHSKNLTIRTMPTSTNYISSITAYLKVNGTFTCNDIACANQTDADNEACEAPANDPAGNPTIAITWEDNTGFTCLRSRNVDPAEDNDKGNGRQFYVSLLNAGNAEIKYGQVDGINGVFRITVNGITANATQLDLSYDLMNEPITIKGGNLMVKSVLGNITKQMEIILYKE